MAESQALVAEDTLRMVSFDRVETLLDIGGGTGAFLTAVGGRARATKSSARLDDRPVYILLTAAKRSFTLPVEQMLHYVVLLYQWMDGWMPTPNHCTTCIFTVGKYE